MVFGNDGIAWVELKFEYSWGDGNESNGGERDDLAVGGEVNVDIAEGEDVV